MRVDVDCSDNEKCTRELENMVEVMKEAVAMEIWAMEFNCSVSLYCHNEATRKARLRLSAITMSPEQSQTRATGDSAWLGIERYALFQLWDRVQLSFSEQVLRGSLCE